MALLRLIATRGCHGPAGEEQALYDTDRELLFRQESYFQWTFGVAEPGFFGIMDVSRRRSVLFMPRLPPEYAVWMGAIHSPQYFRSKYEVDEVLYSDQLDDFLAKADPAVLYTLKGLNSDSDNVASEARFDGVDKYRVDNGRLFPIIANLRVSALAASFCAHLRLNIHCHPLPPSLEIACILSWTWHTCR